MKIADGGIPMPILTCVHVKKDRSARSFQGKNDLRNTTNQPLLFYFNELITKVQVGKDQEKAQSERDSHSKNRGGEKTKLTIRHLYHETYRKPNEQLFSQ